MKTSTRIKQMKKLHASLTDPVERAKAKRSKEREERRAEKINEAVM